MALFDAVQGVLGPANGETPNAHCVPSFKVDKVMMSPMKAGIVRTYKNVQRKVIEEAGDVYLSSRQVIEGGGIPTALTCEPGSTIMSLHQSPQGMSNE
jgi:hypothetical protein